MKKIIPLIVLIVLIVFSLFYGSKIPNNKLVFSEPSNDKSNIIAAFIYGELSTTFPTTENYLTSVECLKPDGTSSTATGAATWNGTKWEVSITGIVEDGTTCNVYFERVEPRGWTASQSGSLLYAIKSTGGTIHNDSDTGMTAPGTTFTTTNEGLRKANDDYGITYYYRGISDTNYVVFADMCWRIVRVDGLGNTKLVLFNNNSNGANNPCATSENGTTKAFALVNDIYLSTFNTNTDKNTYVGFMYSNNPNSSIFDIAHANDNDSEILTFLKSWYDAKLRSYNNDLADVIWCNDKSVVTDTTYDLYGYSPVGTGLGTDSTYYNSIKRIAPQSTAAPSMACPNTGIDGKLSKFTARDTINGNAKLYSSNKEYKIGLLTSDEIVFAGGRIIGTTPSGTDNYLALNSSGSDWWSLSPDLFYNTNGAYNLIFKNPGHINGKKVNGTNIAVRPAIALKSHVTLTNDANQDGTAAHPFVVN